MGVTDGQCDRSRWKGDDGGGERTWRDTGHDVLVLVGIGRREGVKRGRGGTLA